MTEVVDYLINLCRDFLNNKISLVNYITSYENYFYDNQEKFTDKEYNMLDHIYFSNDMYDSNETLRLFYEELLDENQLRTKIVEILNEYGISIHGK